MRGIVCTVLLFFVIAFVNAASDKDYGIMIDAGSSGSRIYLYEWPHRDDPTLPLVEPTTINQVVVSQKINTPLANFTSDPSKAGESLTPLITYVKQNLAQNLWSVTPIYLKATAGMRAIPELDQERIIKDVRDYLKTTGFTFKDDYAKVIPGTDEGVFGWITVNYLLKVLTLINPTTTGALDMGGASTQITFDPPVIPASCQFNVTLAKNDYVLYTYSYPLGQDQSGRLVTLGLFNESKVDASNNILNPCYLTGYEEPYYYNQSIKVIGTSNYAECQAAVLKYVVQPRPDCSTCGMTNIYQPSVSGKYYAFSGFAYTYQFFGLAPTAPISDLISAGQGFCADTFSAAQSKYPTTAAAYLKNYCFTSTYLSEVLKAYGFSTSSQDITVTDKVNGTEVTWALGGMIYEANLLPITKNNDNSDSANGVFISLTIFLLGLFFSMF